MKTSMPIRGGLVAMAAVLTACSGGEPAANKAALPPVDASADSGRPVTKTDSGVVVVPYGGGYLATETITYSNDTGGATRAIVALATAVGDVSSTPGASPYQVAVSLQATGPTEADARHALSTMVIAQSDRLSGGVLQLSARVNFLPYHAPPGQGINVPGVQIGGTEINDRSASVTAVLPAAIDYALTESSDIGNATALGLSGSAANIQSDIGDAILDGTWGSAKVASNIGDAAFTGDAAAFEGFSQIGSVYATLAPSGDADATLATQIGDVDLALAGPATGGFDLSGETEIGAIAIAVHGTEPVSVQPTRQHWQSPGYASASPKVHAQGFSQIGNVSIHD